MVTKTTTISLDQLIDAYLISRRHLSPHTQDYYHNCLHNFRWYVKKAGWPEAAEEITRQHIREFLNYIAESPRRWGLPKCTSSRRQATPATVNHYGRVIKRLFRWACDEEEYLADNGIWRLKLPRPCYRQVEPYSDAEVMAMLDAGGDDSRFLASRNRAIISMFADTGLRLSELAGIRLDDLHSSLKQVRVLGKGSKVRVVPLQGESMRALNRYLMYRPRDGGQWLWLNDDGGPLQMRSIQNMLQRLKRRAGVRSGGGVHRFRHYYATRYLEAGGNPSSLRLLLGHESFAMVLHYTRMVSAQRAVDEHVSPLNELYRGRNRNRDDGWGWREGSLTSASHGICHTSDSSRLGKAPD